MVRHKSINNILRTLKNPFLYNNLASFYRNLDSRQFDLVRACPDRLKVYLGDLKSIFYKKGLRKSGRPLNLQKFTPVFVVIVRPIF